MAVISYRYLIADSGGQVATRRTLIAARRCAREISRHQDAKTWIWDQMAHLHAPREWEISPDGACVVITWRTARNQRQPWVVDP